MSRTCKVLRVEDVSYGRGGTIKRYVYRLVMPTGSDRADVTRAIRWQILRAKAKGRFNALGFFVYASEDELDGPYTIAKADYAPGGRWEDAAKVRAGDYASMELVLTMVG